MIHDKYISLALVISIIMNIRFPFSVMGQSSIKNEHSIERSIVHYFTSYLLYRLIKIVNSLYDLISITLKNILINKIKGKSGPERKILHSQNEDSV